MLGLLKRHEVETLLKAGHKRTEIARVTGISYNSVKRIAKEATIEHFDDTAERRKRRIGRPSIVQGFRNSIRNILEKQPGLPFGDIFHQVQKAGYRGGKSALYALVAVLRPIEPRTKRNEPFEWMRAVQQGAIRRPVLERELSDVTDMPKLLKGMRNGPSPQRKKAMAVLFHKRGIKCSLIRSFLHLSRRSLRSYLERYRRGSTALLFTKRMNARRKCQDDRTRPSLHCFTHHPQYTGLIERPGR